MRKSALVILMAVVSLALPARLAAQETAVAGDEFLLKAQTAYTGGDFSAAIDYLRQAETVYAKSKRVDAGKKTTVAILLGASFYHVENYDDSIRQFEKALTLSRTRHDSETEVMALNGLATTCLALKRYDLVIAYYKQASAIFEKAGNGEYQAVYLAYIAGYYFQLQKPKEAIDYYSAAAGLYTKLKNERETMNMLNNIGSLYFSAGDKEKALEYYTRAYEAGEKTVAPAEAAPLLNNIAAIAQEVKKYGAAAAYFQRLHDMVKDSGSPHDVYLACWSAGRAHYLDGKKTAALKYYQLALGAGRENLSPEELADILSRIADTASALKDLKTAVAHYQELAKLHEAMKSWKELADAYNGLGLAYFESADPKTAVGYFKQAEGLAERIKDPEQLSIIYYNLGQAYDAAGNYKQSLPYLKKYISREENSGDKADFINVLLLAGSSCAHQSLFQDALAYYGRAEKIAAGHPEKEWLEFVGEYYAELHVKTGEYAKALDYYKKGLALCDKFGLKDRRGVVLNDTGTLYSTIGEYGRALDYFNQALAAHMALGNEDQIAIVNGNIGHLYYETGELDKALAFMNMGLAYFEKSADRKPYASALNNIGDVYRLWGNAEQALRHYDAAIRIADELELADMRAIIYNNLGMLSQSEGELSQALAYFNRALGINRESADKAAVAVNLSNIGETYRRQFEMLKAYDYFSEALTIDMELGVHSRIARRLNAVALINSDLGRYEKSVLQLSEAVKYADPSVKFDLATYHHNLGFNYYMLQRYDQAIDHLNQAVAVKEGLRKTAQGTSRMDYLASQIYTYQILALALADAGNPEKALEAAELSRAKYLAEKISNRRGDSAAYPGLAKIRAMIDDDTVIISFSNVGRATFPLRTVVTKQKIEVMKLNPDALPVDAVAMDEIKAANGKTRGLRVAAAGPAAEREEAGAGDAVNFYDTLSNVVYHFRSLILNPEIDFLGNTRAHQLSRALYGFLLGDIGELAGKKKIIIIPDNILGLLPFEALIDGGNRYLVETHDIQYEHSLTVMSLVNGRRYAETRRPLLAFGGAVYDGASRAPAGASLSEKELKDTAALAGRGEGAADIYAHLKDAAWQNLPGTLAEVTSIGKLFGTAAVVTGDRVSEENVKALSKRGELGRYKIIHFAVHGLTVPDYPELSSLVLSLAGLKKGAGDGYLQAPEIAGLDLKADFVNLSACETGLGKIYGGEGIVGLSQSFLIAGANGVSVSLWAVADEPTTKFMTEFYTLVKNKNLKYAAAESAVKRMFIRDRNYRHPYYWAPFVYYGK